MSAFHSLSLGGGWPAFFDVSCASVTFCMALTGTAAVTFSSTERGYTISILGLTAPPTGAPSRARPQGSVWPQAASPVEHIRELGSSRNGTGLDGQLRHVSQSHELMGIQRFPKWYARPNAFCMASDGDGSVFHWNGSKWSPPTHLGPHVADNSFDVTCISSRFCMAMGDNHQVFTWNGSRWSHDSDSNLKGSYALVGCTSPHLCVSVDAAGYAESWDGTLWTPSQFVDPGGNGFDANRANPADSALRWIGLATPSLSRQIRSTGYPPPATRADASRKPRNREPRPLIWS